MFRNNLIRFRYKNKLKILLLLDILSKTTENIRQTFHVLSLALSFNNYSLLQPIAKWNVCTSCLCKNRSTAGDISNRKQTIGFTTRIVTYFHFANLPNVGHAFRCLAQLSICPVMTLNMLIHNNATGHSNGKLWNLNAEKIEKIFSQSQGLKK